MLEALDRLDWHLLTHAYGPADDVPETLRALASDDADARDEAFDSLYGSIAHQGTRYPATAAAVPFVVEILTARRRTDTARLLMLLTRCVAGFLAPGTGPFNGSGPAWAPMKLPAENANEGDAHELLAAIESAAAKAIPTTMELLADPRSYVRTAAAYLLSCFRSYAADSQLVEVITQRLESEHHPVARASLLFALAHLAPLGQRVHLLESALDEENATLRLVAALMLADRGSHREPAPVDAPPARVAEVLTDALARPERCEAYAAMPWSPEGVLGDAATGLLRLGGSVVRTALPTLLDALAKVDDFDAVGLLDAALAGAFSSGEGGDGGRAPPPSDARSLTPPQRKLCEVLVHNEDFWTIGNALNRLIAAGLPSSREEMARYLGIEPVDDPRRARIREARRYREAGAVERAMQAYEQAVELCADASLFYEMGTLAAEEHLAEDAVAFFDMALAQDAGHLRACFDRGAALAALDRWQDADEAFARAAELMDDPRPAWKNRVTALQHLDRHAEALALLDKAQLGGGQSVEDLYERGLALVKAGDHAAAIEIIDRMLALEPHHPLAHYTIACAYALRGETRDALRHVAEAVRADPGLREAIREDPDFSALNDDARFVAACKDDEAADE